MNSDQEKTKFQLTGRQAYMSMFCFIKNMHDIGWIHLGGLLGSMALIDGIPMDAAITDDWLDAVRYVLAKEECAEASRYLDDKQAYAAMFSFLEQMYRENRENLSTLVLDLDCVDGGSINEHVVSIWDQAFEFAFLGGKVPPVTLIKDGLVIELHRDEGPQGSSKS